MCSLSTIAAVNRTVLLASSASNRRWLYMCGAVFYLLSVLKPVFFLQSLCFCAFTLFYGMAEVLHGFWLSQGFFRDEEHSLGFSVLRIGSYIVMVHAFIRGFRVSSYANLEDFGTQTCRIFFALSFFLFMHQYYV